MTEFQPLCQTLQDLWYAEIPLSKAMSMQIVSFDGHELVTEATLAPNRNVHGTAFAGSLYAIAALTGWGLVHLRLQLAGLEASVVIASGSIDYACPVAETIRARSRLEDESHGMAALRQKRKGRFSVNTDILLADGASASAFAGSYAARLAPALV